MSKFLLRENLTVEQADALEKAAFLIITARQEAVEILVQSGVQLPPDHGWWGNPCMAKEEVGIPCGCSNYKGDGGPCLTLTTTDPGFPPSRSCGHPPSDHVPT